MLSVTAATIYSVGWMNNELERKWQRAIEVLFWNCLGVTEKNHVITQLCVPAEV
jgi:hypothetical protein